MKGLEISRKFYNACKPQLEQALADLLPLAAIGLVGEGSECFGLDDEISRDHDFTSGFCIWLPRETIVARRREIAAALEGLPREFMGLPTAMTGESPRRGLIPIEDFYRFFTGLEHPPQTLLEWLAIPEQKLAAATNGEIFAPGDGKFTNWRKKLLDFYPQDVWLKKLAARVMIMAQSGQYNLPRSLQRGNAPAALLALGRFSEAALSFAFLINRQYAPYYKLAPGLCQKLPQPGPRLFALLEKIAAGPLNQNIADEIEQFCSHCASQLRATGLSDCPDDWLWAHGPAIIRHAADPGLRSMNLLEG